MKSMMFMAMRLTAIWALPMLGAASASDVDEFRVQREPVFEFVRKPV